jgi:TRAP-type C4-dicarboxylate transport system substrate-binding protein
MIPIRSKLKRSLSLLALICAVTVISGAIATAEEVTLKAQSALPKNHDLTQSFLALYVDKVNEAGKGIVQINYIGGPEVTPADKAAQAVQRGVIDMLHSPAAYYAGITPQSLALMATNMTPAEVRANGGFDNLTEVWKEKLNAKIVAWGESGAQFHLYLSKEPPLDADGNLDLTGLKIRTTGAYRPLVTALGASAVEMPVGDVYTALQRGVVDGFGWPTVGLKALGLADAIKYRIDPPFYHLANMVLVNQDKWDALPQEAKDVLLNVGAEYEEASIKRMQEAAAIDEQAITDAGVTIYNLEGKAGDAYLNAAYGAAWDRIAEKLDEGTVKELRSKMLKE